MTDPVPQLLDSFRPPNLFVDYNNIRRMLRPQGGKLTPASNFCPAFAVWDADVEVVAEEAEEKVEIGPVFVREGKPVA